MFGQLVGHSLFNFVLRSISPTMVALGGLFTVPLAAIIAAFALGETPPAAAIPAMALLHRRDRAGDQCAGARNSRVVASAASSAMQIAEPTHQMQIASSSQIST